MMGANVSHSTPNTPTYFQAVGSIHTGRSLIDMLLQQQIPVFLEK